MNKQLCRIIRETSRPQVPVPTGEIGSLQLLENIRAVFFDIYGTLFISCSGEIGAIPMYAELDRGLKVTGDTQGHALPLALGKKFIELYPNSSQQSSTSTAEKHAATQGHNEYDYRQCGNDLISAFQNKVRKIHEAKQQEGIPWPEVDVREIWGKIISEKSEEAGPEIFSHIDRWATEYEVRTNPVWPMPNATDCIDRLGSANLTLGIISNAQFYTPLLFPALMNRQLEELEISAEMQYYSYRGGRSKPDVWMFHQAAKALAKKSITPRQTLYVGNDMLNDILPAAQVGFRTALFAADKRSLRLRKDDPRVSQTVPDIVVTNLEEVADCVLK
jgi:putative hydrolase of the HAD superfamily